jgi:glycosyltransferase involved in cell wall biosynthesis
MRICIVTPNVIRGDGQGRVNYEIAREALRRGHGLAILANRIDDDLVYDERVEAVFCRRRLPTVLLNELDFRQQSARWLRRNRGRYDIVSVCGGVTSISADVVTAHFTYAGWWSSPAHIWKVEKSAYSFYQLVCTQVERRWERAAYLSSQHRSAVSSRIKQELVALGIEQDSVKVIYNGVDLDEFRLGEASREALGLPSSVTLALFVGDIRLNRKNLDAVLKALAVIPNLHLAVAGDTERSPYPAVARSLGLGDRVHFLGRRRDVAAIMRSCDFFVFPSHYEGFALVVVEAMASGLPVIVSNLVGTCEIVTEESGIVISGPDDWEALTQAMAELAGDSALRARMGRQARRIAEGHSWATKAAEYVDFFEYIRTADQRDRCSGTASSPKCSLAPVHPSPTTSAARRESGSADDFPVVPRTASCDSGER